MSGLNAWFGPVVLPSRNDLDPETDWVEENPHGNPQVRRWKRPTNSDPWNAGCCCSVYGKSILAFLPMIVIPLVAEFFRPFDNGKKECRIEQGYKVCRTYRYHYAYVKPQNKN
jgi:hypothetical protein